jgi:hypothetical protein
LYAARSGISKSRLKTCSSFAPRLERLSRSLSGKSRIKKATRASASPLTKSTVSVSCLPTIPRKSILSKFTKMGILARHFKLYKPNSRQERHKMLRKAYYPLLLTADSTPLTFAASTLRLNQRRVPSTCLHGNMPQLCPLRMTTVMSTLTI